MGDHGLPRGRQPANLTDEHAYVYPANFTGLGTVTGMRACSAGNFAPYNTKTAAYEDNVVSWPSVEPADDYTANSLMAFALGAAGLG